MLDGSDRVGVLGLTLPRLDDHDRQLAQRLAGLVADLMERTTAADLTCAETVRRLSHALMAARSGRTSDDSSLLLREWKGPPREDELDPDVPEATPTD